MPAEVIAPRTLKGFRDFPPALAMAREQLVDTARGVYRSYGFAPVDTPALEYSEVLLGKLDPAAEIQRQLYRFVDHGGRDVALRFDLTVPFARFAARHMAELGTPFKRYQVGPVWRGENTQAGRYREFVQCDFDTIGTTDNAADVETALVIHDLMASLGFERFTIRVNSRLVLSGVLRAWDLSGAASQVLRALDKLAKQGREAVAGELVGAGLDPTDACRLLDLVEADGDSTQLLDRAVKEAVGDELAAEGARRLAELLDVAAAVGVPEGRIQVDLGISRGLDYYTGTVYETFLDDLPAIGSVCSGGRYDDLAGLYTRQVLPGVGGSLGLDRLLAAMESLGMVSPTAAPAPVLVLRFAEGELARYHRLAAELRRAGVGAEVYPETKRVGAQLQYADRRGFRLALLAGPSELAAGSVTVKDLSTGGERAVPDGEVVTEVARALAP